MKNYKEEAKRLGLMQGYRIVSPSTAQEKLMDILSVCGKDQIAEVLDAYSKAYSQIEEERLERKMKLMSIFRNT